MIVEGVRTCPDLLYHNSTSGGPEVFPRESHLGVAETLFGAVGVDVIDKPEAVADQEYGNDQTHNQSDNKKPRLVIPIHIRESLEQENGAHPDHQELDHIEWIEG